MNNWSLLNKNQDKRHIIESIKKEWIKLIDDTKTNEHHVHEFIDKHSSLFFGAHHGFIVSKVKLADKYVTDLVIMRDNASYGFEYELIELESPNDKTFTKKGIQKSELTEAMQQIEDWQRWIKNHIESAKKLFPSKAFNITNEPKIKYSIIIGRRKEIDKNNNKRLQKVNQYGIDIRSFDYLTDLLDKNTISNFPDFEIPTFGDNILTKEELNQLISPFKKSLTHSDWNKITQSTELCTSHMAGFNWKLFLKYIKVNEEILNKFREQS